MRFLQENENYNIEILNRNFEEMQSFQHAFVGAVFPFIANTPPDGFLCCDVGIYNIDQYNNLASFFKAQFGKSNYFGGDGTDTFSVPDLRGEFLRGAGGRAAAVGKHQNATTIPDISNSGKDINGSLYGKSVSDADYWGGSSNSSYYAKTGTYSSLGRYGYFAVLPNNTSVLWCIKY